MSNGKLIDWYKGLPPWARGVMIVGGSAVVVYTGYEIIKGINDKKKQKLAEAEVLGTLDDLNDLGSKGIVPSYPQSQYEQWADGIQTTFTGCDPSRSNFVPLIFSPTNIGDASTASHYSNSGAYVLNIVLGLHNDADFLALQAAWSGPTGSRSISKHWWCGGDIDNATLTAAIADQLNTDERTALNTVLKSLGITYKL